MTDTIPGMPSAILLWESPKGKKFHRNCAESVKYNFENVLLFNYLSEFVPEMTTSAKNESVSNFTNNSEKNMILFNGQVAFVEFSEIH